MDPLAAKRHRDQGEVPSAAFVPRARPAAASGQERGAAATSATRASAAGQESTTATDPATLGPAREQCGEQSQEIAEREAAEQALARYDQEQRGAFEELSCNLHAGGDAYHL